ncbi:hypothetical protein ABCS02_03735 [Microbacterium sp. X-17]|uniref:hypothetical protein n=1 Tax=Microbacterium sp. X-17 TaxID=3144404 RepID=UPI0031F548A2
MTRTPRRASGSIPVAVLCVLAAGTLAIGQVPALASTAAVFWLGGLVLVTVALIIGLARRRRSRDSRG